MGEVRINNEGGDKSATDTRPHCSCLISGSSNEDALGNLREVVKVNAQRSLIKIGVDDLTGSINESPDHIAHSACVTQLAHLFWAQVTTCDVGAVWGGNADSKDGRIGAPSALHHL
jgi:hypothetical protein